MNLEKGKQYHGFQLEKQKAIKELNATANLFFHEKSGARLLYLQNDDDNKVFSISFRTPPPDNTGVPHIMEHSVLCGSRKFPLREPFVELVKGSLNTFLNAITYPDKTVYPIASRNDKDFTNLMDVYLDAVFYPSLHTRPETMMQEGWHYELEDKDQPLAYKGVVYNEMKGAYSSPEQVLFAKIQESLYPDTPYAYESGGDPDFIPDLTQERFEAFHKKYYHPSNSYIYLYGNGDMDAHLRFIDGEYLSHFDRQTVHSEIPVQKPFSKMSRMDAEYSVSAQDNPADKAYLSLNYSIGQSTDPFLYLAFNILEYLLLDNPAAPLKKALLEAGIGKDVFGSFENSIQQPFFSIIVKDANEEDAEKFRQVTETTLRNLAAKGIDKRLVEAAINFREFKLREADFGGSPKGLIYGIRCMDSWLYGEDPTMHLYFEDTLTKIRKALTEPLFEELIEKYILNNAHSSMVIAKPKPGLAEKKDQETEDKLRDYKKTLTESQVEEIIHRTRELKRKQSEPDSAEALATIPTVELSDIEPKAEELPLEKKTQSGIPVLHHPLFTNGISYVNLWFNTDAIPVDLLPYAGLLVNVLGQINTKNYSYEELSNEINIHTGGIEYSIQSLALNAKDGEFKPKLLIQAKSLADKLPRLMELLCELVNETLYQDTGRLREIVQEVRSRMEMVINQSGNIIALNRVSSYFSPAGKYTELVSGIEYYRFLSHLERNFDSEKETLVQKLEQAASLIFQKSNLVASVTLPEEDYPKFSGPFDRFADSLKQEESAPAPFPFRISAENEGLMTPSKVQYVAKGYSFLKMGYHYTGSMQVLRTIANMDYLWNRVRIQGGAYGVSVVFTRSGMMIFTSYRDPSLRETLENYDGLSDYLSGFEADEREMKKYIIGTISSIDAPLTPQMKGGRADINYFTGLSQSQIQQERREILRTKAEDIKALAGLARDITKNNFICVLGGEGKIEANKDLFKKRIRVFGQE